MPDEIFDTIPLNILLKIITNLIELSFVKVIVLVGMLATLKPNKALSPSAGLAELIEAKIIYAFAKSLFVL